MLGSSSTGKEMNLLLQTRGKSLFHERSVSWRSSGNIGSKMGGIAVATILEKPRTSCRISSQAISMTSIFLFSLRVSSFLLMEMELDAGVQTGATLGSGFGITESEFEKQEGLDVFGASFQSSRWIFDPWFCMLLNTGIIAVTYFKSVLDNRVSEGEVLVAATG
ncbi:hypothetical protein Tco_1346942 [Tanacetum coccineum]